MTNYTYDGLGRLTQEAESGAADAKTYAYTYDNRNNRNSLTVTGAAAYTVNYQYDLNDRMSRNVKTAGAIAETTNYWYDPNGNNISTLTETVAPSSEAESLSLGGDGWALNEYNGFNQLIAVEKDGISTSYTYKPDGLRYSKTTTGVTTTHIWDGQNVVAEVSGGTTTTYLRGINLIKSDSVFYSFNAHGDVVGLTDGSGTVTKGYRYDAFGVEQDPSSTDNNVWRYCGEMFDRETGTVYLRACLISSHDPQGMV
jgi:YD repeat-containing protein